MTNTFGDAAIAFLKRVRVDETLGPHTLSSTMFSMVARLGDYVALLTEFDFSSDLEQERDPNVFVEQLVGITVNSMTLQQMLWDLEYYAKPDTLFDSEPTDQGADGEWGIRGRIASILSDVYRDLLLRLVAADPHLSPQPQEA